MSSIPPPPPGEVGVRRRTFSLVACGVAVLGASILPGMTAGLNVVLVSLALAAAVAGARREDLNLWSWVFGGCAVLLVTMFIIRTSGWVLAVDLVAAGGLGVLAIARSHSWAGV